MLKVLLVEDELMVRLGVRASIDWGALGMEVVADAENGRTAWNAYQTHKPQIVITDLRMPVMDGMELIRRIRAESATTKIIILSCVEDFELAREAISLGVSDYILKLTMSREEMEGVVRRVGAELSSPGAVEGPPEKAKADHLSAEDVLGEFLFSGRVDEEEFARRMQVLAPDLSPRNLILSVMEIGPSAGNQGGAARAAEGPVRISVESLVHRVLSGYRAGIIARCREDRFVLIFSFPAGTDAAAVEGAAVKTLRHVQRVMRSYFDCTATLGMSAVGQGFSSLRGMYHSATRVLESRYVRGTGEIITPTAASPQNVVSALESRIAGMIDGLHAGSHELARVLGKEADAFLKSCQGTQGECRMLFLQLGRSAVQLLATAPERSAGLLSAFSRDAEGCSTLDEMVGLFEHLVGSLTALGADGIRCSPEVAQTLEFVKKHHAERLSLERVARAVGLSRNYLCTLFKNETGMGLAEYVLRQRIERAKLLLRETTKRVHEVSAEVGFADESYFSRSFKRVTGTRPNAFRKRWVSRVGEAP